MTVSANINRRPLLPIITLKKNDNSLYTFNPFTSTFDFRVRRLQVKPPYSNTSGQFTLKLTSSDASNSNSNTLINNVDEGNEVTIWIGKSDATKTKIFTGVVESWEISENNKNFMDLTISGPDFGSDILKNRIVHGKWGQELDTNGDTVTTDTTTSVQQIVLDLLTIPTFYPSLQGSVTAEDQGIIVNSANIKGATLQLKTYQVNYEFIGDKLQELNEIGGTVHYVDPDKNFIMDYPITLNSPSSGILLTDDNNDATAIAWDATKVGLVAPDSTLVRTLENSKRRIFGMGGINISVDQSSTTDAGSTTLESYNYAMKFTPDYSTVSIIKLHLSKIGTPVEDFVMELREDALGKPIGKVLKVVSKNKNFLNDSGTTKVVSTFEINAEVVRGQNYWIVVRKNGTSASHTFRWHHDNVSHSSSLAARAATDINDWALLTSNKFYYAFEEFKGDEVKLELTKFPLTATTKHIHEDTIRKENVTTDAVMRTLLIQEARTLFKRKDIFKCSVYAPDTLLVPGIKVRIRKQASGYTFDDEFVLGEVEYVFESSDDQTTGNFYYFIEAVKFTEID